MKSCEKLGCAVATIPSMIQIRGFQTLCVHISELKIDCHLTPSEYAALATSDTREQAGSLHADTRNIDDRGGEAPSNSNSRDGLRQHGIAEMTAPGDVCSNVVIRKVVTPYPFKQDMPHRCWSQKTERCLQHEYYAGHNITTSGESRTPEITGRQPD